MDKNSALEILNKNIYRQLVKKWFLLDFVFIIIAIVIYLAPIQPLAMILPSPILKVENVYPSIFTGTITVVSILIGFFSVSAFNFHQQFERSIQSLDENVPRVRTRLESHLVDKGKLEEKKKNTINPEEMEKLNEHIKSVDSAISETNELLELINLNIDACAHMQEHISIFISTYIGVGVFVAILLIYIFLATLGSSAFDGYFLLSDLISIYVMFTGLGLFMGEFTRHRAHKERY